MVNALWLLIGLIRSKTFVPQPGWGRFALQVLAASAVLTMFLVWANHAVPWVALHDQKLKRIALLVVAIATAVAVYFFAIWASGLKIRPLLRR